MPFGEWIDFWYQTYCAHTLRITTKSDYENRIYNHIIPEIGKIPLNKLSQSDLQQFYAKEKTGGRKLYAETLGKGLSDRTIRAIHANCRTALQRAVQDGLIRTNPAVGCKLPPKKAREVQVLTQNEILRFLHQAKDEGITNCFCWNSEQECAEVKYWRSNGATSTFQQVNFASNGRYILSRHK